MSLLVPFKRKRGIAMRHDVLVALDLLAERAQWVLRLSPSDQIRCGWELLLECFSDEFVQWRSKFLDFRHPFCHRRLGECFVDGIYDLTLNCQSMDVVGIVSGLSFLQDPQS